MGYPEKDLIEREQVEWIHGLTGGELADQPMRFATIERGERWVTVEGNKGRYEPHTEIKRGWARYWYEGPPEWSELARAQHRRNGAMITLVWNSGAYGNCTPPARMISGGKRWRKIATYTSGGECECPGKDDEEDGKVTRRTAKLEPRHEPWAWARERPSHRSATCPLCEERIGEEHGMIYLGEGWIEVVYYARG